MKVLKKILIIILLIVMFYIIARLDNIDTTTSKIDIKQAQQQRIKNINSKH